MYEEIKKLSACILPVLALLAVVLIGKPLTAAFLVSLRGESRPMALQIGGALSQIGEFTFVLGTSAKGLDLNSANQFGTASSPPP